MNMKEMSSSDNLLFELSFKIPRLDSYDYRKYRNRKR